VTSDVSLVGVYRARHAHFVQRLCEPALERGWQIAWWALDDVVDELAAHTVGDGPGAKFPLLNHLLSHLDTKTPWLVVSDDDLTFERRDVVALQRLCARAGFDLAQPARVDETVSHPITSACARSVARRTSFVEIGPLFVVGPGWRDRIVPFPKEHEMGWGLELDWFELEREGCTLGIVDAVPIRHETPHVRGYDAGPEFERLHREFARRGLTWDDVQLTYETWRPWRFRPPWRGRISPPSAPAAQLARSPQP
jgi:hypothetical protein